MGELFAEKLPHSSNPKSEKYPNAGYVVSLYQESEWWLWVDSLHLGTYPWGKGGACAHLQSSVAGLKGALPLSHGQNFLQGVYIGAT